MVPLSEARLRAILKIWVAHYGGRPHSSLGPGVARPFGFRQIWSFDRGPEVTNPAEAGLFAGVLLCLRFSASAESEACEPEAEKSKRGWFRSSKGRRAQEEGSLREERLNDRRVRPRVQEHA